MTTSGVTEWGLTAAEVIRQALIELGVMNGGDEPEATEETDAMLRLNAMFKTWGGEANLFREATGTLVIVGGSGAGTLPADVRQVNSVRHVSSATYQRPLLEWNRDQYYSLPNRVAVGNPTMFYLSKTPLASEIRIWPVPASDITLHVDYSRAVETVTDPQETLDIPQEWQEAVILGLAARCAAMFGATRLDPATVQRIDAAASAMYQKLLDRDRPDSYYFEQWDSCYP